MTKSKETYKKVAETFKKKADREWAKAKNDEGGHHYKNAQSYYETVKKAQEKADRMWNNKRSKDKYSSHKFGYLNIPLLKG